MTPLRMCAPGGYRQGPNGTDQLTAVSKGHLGVATPSLPFSSIEVRLTRQYCVTKLRKPQELGADDLPHESLDVSDELGGSAANTNIHQLRVIDSPADLAHEHARDVGAVTDAL